MLGNMILYEVGLQLHNWYLTFVIYRKLKLTVIYAAKFPSVIKIKLCTQMPLQEMQ